ncbi:MAG: O-methyltransferase [Acidobacteriota bacterium]
MLVGISKAKKVVELGTLAGFSALIMAEALPDGGQIVTCETDPLHPEIARRFFARSPHGRQRLLGAQAALPGSGRFLHPDGGFFRPHCVRVT